MNELRLFMYKKAGSNITLLRNKSFFKKFKMCSEINHLYYYQTSLLGFISLPFFSIFDVVRTNPLSFDTIAWIITSHFSIILFPFV